MNRLPLALAASLALLAGCGGERQASVSVEKPAQAVAVAPPVDLLGTWTDQGGRGFIAIGARQVVVALDGTPRLVAIPIENAIEPGMTAGKLGLAGGSSLFLARGVSMVSGLSVDHIDVEVVGADGSSLRRRLHSEAGLRMAARMQPTPPAPAPVPAVLPTPDRHSAFIAAAPAVHRQSAELMVAKARSGATASELARTFGESQRQAYVGILAKVVEARSLPAEQSPVRLEEADRRRKDSETFARAWRSWMAAKG